VQWHGRIDRGLGAMLAPGRWLALPVSLLLFAQWPLRDLVQAYSTQANDLAQWLFALYVSLAITDATRAGTHLASDAFARAYAPRTRRLLARFGALFGAAPWAGFVLAASLPGAIQSVRQLESFPETYSPGYFMIRVGVSLLALLVLAQALLDATRPTRAAA
jgi:TRAP-type C4-dicarboxylate transport system permease small subunit